MKTARLLAWGDRNHRPASAERCCSQLNFRCRKKSNFLPRWKRGASRPTARRRRVARSRAAQHGRTLIVAEHVVSLGLRLGLLRGLRGKSGFQRLYGLPLPLGDPVAVDVPRRRDGKPSRRLAVSQRLVHGLGLQRHGLGICAVEAGIVEAVIDPKRNRHQPRAAAGEEFNHRDGARTPFVLLVLFLRLLVLVGSLVFGAVANLRGDAELTASMTASSTVVAQLPDLRYR